MIRRNMHNLDSNPLTRLPGNNKIQEIIAARMRSEKHFAVAYTDLDNFKAYNDKYGFKRGDDLILFTAGIIKQSVDSCGTDNDFVGHIGGDDFVIIASPESMNEICQEIIKRLDIKITDFYDEKDKNLGYIETRNRQGKYQKFPFVSISIAVTNNLNRQFTGMGEIVRTITELKKYAKQKKGSCLVFDKRST